MERGQRRGKGGERWLEIGEVKRKKKREKNMRKMGKIERLLN